MNNTFCSTTQFFGHHLKDCTRMLECLPVSVTTAIQDITCSTVVCASIHFGGRLALPTTTTTTTHANHASSTTNRIPTTISSPPVTLHTLAATVSGMIFGPQIGSGGALLHVLLWLYTQKGIGPSMGYVIGMIPCTSIAGWLFQQAQPQPQQSHHEPLFEHKGVGWFFMPLVSHSSPPPFLSTCRIAIMAQLTTLSCGVSFLYVWNIHKTHKLEQHPTVEHTNSTRKRLSFKDVWMIGALPFVPGLLIKSILAWIFLFLKSTIFDLLLFQLCSF